MKKKIAGGAAILLAVLAVVFIVRGCSDSAPIQNQPTKATETVRSHHIDVPYLSQQERYPTGCESVSAVMALRYCGVDITVDDFIDNCLECGSIPYEYDGLLYGDSPFEVFLGSPYDEQSLGCYAPVIRKAMEKALGTGASEGNELNAATGSTQAGAARVADLSGSSLEQLCRDYIDRDIPVILWASIRMQPLSEKQTWILPDGSEFTWKSPEHCLVLVGYDEDSYYFNDPDQSKDTPYSKADVERAFAGMYSQALAIVKE